MMEYVYWLYNYNSKLYTIKLFPCGHTPHSIFENYSNDSEYTTNRIFRRIVSPDCPKCGYRMNHSGHKEHCKKGISSVKIGRYVCPICEEPLEESRSFWEQLKTDFFECLKMYLPAHADSKTYRTKAYHWWWNSYSPEEKTPFIMISVESVDIPPIGDVQIVHYDEQHPKMGRAQKFRRTLLDGVNGSPRAIHRCHCL